MRYYLPDFSQLISGTSYYLYMLIDPDNTITEQDEDNNIFLVYPGSFLYTVDIESIENRSAKLGNIYPNPLTNEAYVELYYQAHYCQFRCF